MAAAYTLNWLARDLVRVTLHGDLEPDVSAQLMALMYRTQDTEGYILTLADVSAMNTISLATRRSSHQHIIKRAAYRGSTAIIGAQAALRVIINLFLRAVRFTQHREVDEVRFFKAEQEGLAWLAERRQYWQRSPVLP